MIAVFACIGVVLVLLLAAAVFLFQLACGPNSLYLRMMERKSRGAPEKPNPYQAELDAGRAWFRAQPWQTWYLTSYDGLTLEAAFLPTAHPRGTILLAHGYRSSGVSDFGAVAEHYQALGFQLLSISQRAHGGSGGRYICFGVRERYDCRDWCRLLAERYPGLPIVLSGLSMGSSTVLMASGLALPEEVRCIVSDCGFTSPWDEFAHLLRQIHMPVHPILDLANAAAHLWAGFGFREASTLMAMEKNTRPVLFVHGLADTFVPPWMTQRAYDACRTEKKIRLVPGAGHGYSYLVDKPGCQRALDEFLERYVP